MFYFVFIFSVGILSFSRIMAYGMGRYVRRNQIKLDRANTSDLATVSKSAKKNP